MPVSTPLDPFSVQRSSAGGQKLCNVLIHQTFQVKVRKNFLAGKLSSNGIIFSEEVMGEWNMVQLSEELQSKFRTRLS